MFMLRFEMEFHPKMSSSKIDPKRCAEFIQWLPGIPTPSLAQAMSPRQPLSWPPGTPPPYIHALVQSLSLSVGWI